MLRVGLDIGNAAVKLVGPYASHRLLLPHAVATVRRGDRQADLLPVGGTPEAHLHLELETEALGTRELVAGEVAVREYPHLVDEVRDGERKANSDRHLTLALAALAVAVQHTNPGSDSVALTVATALPLAEARDAEARQALAARLRGTHRVRWLSTPGWMGQSLTLHVHQVDVIPEGAAAYLALIAQRPELLSGVTVVIDIGARSVDWAVFDGGGQFRLGLSAGTADGGLVVAADRILVAARERYGPHVGRHRQDVLAALRAAGQGPVYLYGRGERYDVTELASRELHRLAKEVGRLLVEVVDRVGRADHLALVGGGGAALAPYLRDLTGLPLVVPDGAEWANAEGLYRRALHLQAVAS